MQIDRSNYEIWIIDWLDGNLNSLQAEQLKLFLDQNDDLREELLDLATLTPESYNLSFPSKENLKKSPSDISPSQFEYLCAAYLENDLTSNQQAELEEIVKAYPDKKKTFDQIRKTIIVPKRIPYKHKSRLFKQTTLKKAVRLSVICLSTAAAVSLIIVLHSVIPSSPFSGLNNTEHNIVSDNDSQQPSHEIPMDRITRDSIIVAAEDTRYNREARVDKKENIIPYHDGTVTLTNDSAVRINDRHEAAVEKVPVHSQVDLRNAIACNTLIPTNLVPDVKDVTDITDERSHVGRFISKTFREKFLKEKSPADTPLKGYEIAGAGVSGLNKLLGWQMALDMENDENGQPKTVNFRSGILKIQAPVKKREAQP